MIHLKRGAMAYKRAAFLFMSGTGNSFRAAQWAAERASGAGVEASVLPVPRRPGAVSLEAGPEMLLGIFMPTHGFTAPWLVLKRSLQLPRGRGTHAVCVATRGALKFGRVHTPGLAGTATFIVALILALKGYRVRGVLGLDMPSNWMSLHSGLRTEKVTSIVERGERTLCAFVSRVLGGDRGWGSWSNLYDLLFGLALVPVSVAYLAMGHIGLAKIFFASDACTRCGACEKHCPCGGVTLCGRDRRPFWSYRCESCMRCMAFCPQQDIQASQSYCALLIYVSTLPLAAWVVSGLVRVWPGAVVLAEWTLLRWLVLWLLWYALVVLSYRLFYFLQRFRWANWVFEHTTFTGFYRRYREPSTRVKDLG